MSNQNNKIRMRKELPTWELRVVDAFNVTPNMRRVIFTSKYLDSMDYRPGQALSLFIPLPEGEPGRRYYTIRTLDKHTKQLSIDFVLHGNTPAPDWAKDTQAGETINARGPRGRTIINAAADWHLFCGDETCIPAILHMLESLEPTAKVHAFLEVDAAADYQTVPEAFASGVTWVHRNGHAPGPNTLLLDRLAEFELPEGKGHAYLIGETSNVRAQRHAMVMA